MIKGDFVVYWATTISILETRTVSIIYILRITKPTNIPYPRMSILILNNGITTKLRTVRFEKMCIFFFAPIMVKSPLMNVQHGGIIELNSASLELASHTTLISCLFRHHWTVSWSGTSWIFRTRWNYMIFKRSALFQLTYPPPLRGVFSD